MGEDITKLKGKRKVYERFMKSSEEDVTGLYEKDFKNDDVVAKLESIRDNCKDKLELINILNDEILVLLENSQDDYEKELGDNLSRDSTYKEQLTKMNRRLEKHRIVTESEYNLNQAMMRQTLEPPVPLRNSSIRAKLPKLEIKKIDEDLELARILRSI